MKAELVEKFISDVVKAIELYGYKSIQTNSFINKMGYKKRSEENLLHITKLFKDRGLFIFPKLSLELKWKENLRIYNFPVEALCDLFATEKELEEFIIDNNKILDFGLKNQKVQFSANKTRDKMDMVGYDKDRNPVVLEFKNLDGGKSAVEQVFRYISQLRIGHPEKNVKGALITGVRGVETAHALCGMDAEKLAGFTWYLYNYNKAKQTIHFEDVKMSELRRFLK